MYSRSQTLAATALAACGVVTLVVGCDPDPKNCSGPTYLSLQSTISLGSTEADVTDTLEKKKLSFQVASAQELRKQTDAARYANLSSAIFVGEPYAKAKNSRSLVKTVEVVEVGFGADGRVVSVRCRIHGVGP